MTKSYLAYATVTVGVIAVTAACLLAFAFRGPGDAAAVWASAAVAAVIQIGMFGPVRRLALRQVMVGWGVGALVRFVTLVVYGLLVVTILGLPHAAALVGLAAFLFLTTLFEPLFLKR